MPGPPPPPPPGCPPPPMPAMPFAPAKTKGSGDERSALLNAIRKQPKLNKVDKSLINDRSDPLAAAKPKGSGNTMQFSSSARGGGPHAGSYGGPPNGMGLGGLFQGGMPKLKSVNRNAGDAPPSPMVSNSDDIQEELRRRLNNDTRNTNRGPAPPAPTRNFMNELSSLQSKNGYHSSVTNKTNYQISSHSHRKTQSNGNFSALDASATTTNTKNNNSTTAPSTATSTPKQSFGKPHLAPKPPVLEKPSHNNLSNGKLRKSLSVRLPSSPMSQMPMPQQDNNNPSLPHLSDMDKSKTLGGSTGQLHQIKHRPINGRPTVPPPSIPTQLNKVKPPNHAPPPPPSSSNQPAIPHAPNHAPPPPPHRTVPPVPSRAPPSVPSSNAPAPPPRNSSIRPIVNGASFESRFNFHPVSDFPPPMQFRNVQKVYTTRQG